MSAQRKRSRRHPRKKIIVHGVAAGGTVTLAALGLSNCNEGGVVDPPPPPPVVCADTQEGQILGAFGSVQDSVLTVTLLALSDTIDTLYVTDVAGARLDSLDADGAVRLSFTLEAETTSQVTFTVAGTFGLEAGPCDFTRTFTATLHGGSVDLAQRGSEIPLGVDRNVRIELVERNGLRVRLKAVGADDRAAQWRVTAGTLDRRDPTSVVWKLPAVPGFYQVELVVDRGDRGFGFDALSLEVS